MPDYRAMPLSYNRSGAVGIDLGCKEAITLSTGEQIFKPEFIKGGATKKYEVHLKTPSQTQQL